MITTAQTLTATPTPTPGAPGPRRRANSVSAPLVAGRLRSASVQIAESAALRAQREQTRRFVRNRAPAVAFGGFARS
ncbi:MAG: hypothetical protein J6K25_02875 [Thermoguttaceae bacterium]|nr:hypothetical protein [Thermoguttaceae bacterium]